MITNGDVEKAFDTLSDAQKSLPVREQAHIVYDVLKDSLSKDSSITTSFYDTIRKLERTKKAKRELFKKNPDEVTANEWRGKMCLELKFDRQGRPSRPNSGDFLEKMRLLIEEHSEQFSLDKEVILSNFTDHCRKKWKSKIG